MSAATMSPVRMYRLEKARKARRDAKLIATAKVEYDRLCAAHKIMPRATKVQVKHKPDAVCACGAKCWGVRCRSCRKANPSRTFTKSKKMVGRRAA
jgi:hypothetical protein